MLIGEWEICAEIYRNVQTCMKMQYMMGGIITFTIDGVHTGPDASLGCSKRSLLGFLHIS